MRPESLPPAPRQRIRLLPETTINRIAAGEVVERPAAAARELVENAIDAGARRIAVAIEAGGIDRIEVVDDGVGMDGDELALAVQRHATSKLADDALVRIATLGFRGEALPSIAAAARLAITSRPTGTAHAMAIRVEGGAVGVVGPAAGAVGTRVVVRDLFFATPARRKFLKTPRAEAAATEAAMRRLAIAVPEIAFRLECDGRTAFDLPPQSREARVAALLDETDAGTLIAVEGTRDGATLSGFVAPPSITRATQGAQALIVNGRPVADPVLRTALRIAFRDVIAPGRHPVAALFLDVPGDEIDVNVHPAKAEVRFRDPDAIRGLVIGSIGRALARGAGPAAPLAWPGSDRRPALALVPPAPRSPGGFAEPVLPLAAPPASRAAAAAELRDDFPLGAPVAQWLDTYVLAIASDGSLVLVDQHAAHERLTHEALRAQLLDGEVRRQPLLLPAIVDLPDVAARRLAEVVAALARLGLDIEPFGAGAIMVRSMPAALGAADPAPLLRDLADELADWDEATALEARLDAAIARMACHGSIRAGRRLAPAEMDALLRAMEATPRAATCSHGRPTFLKLSRADVERLFGRR